MDATVKAQNMALNLYFKRLNEKYHSYAVYCGISDPTLWVLYSVWGSEVPLTQNDICEKWMYPKQTVNFTISGLVKKGYVQLEQRSGAHSGKAVCLTEQGRELCKKIIQPLIEAEEKSLLDMTEPARKLMIGLLEKHGLSFENEIGKLMGDTAEG